MDGPLFSFALKGLNKCLGAKKGLRTSMSKVKFSGPFDRMAAVGLDLFFSPIHTCGCPCVRKKTDNTKKSLSI